MQQNFDNDKSNVRGDRWFGDVLGWFVNWLCLQTEQLMSYFSISV